MLATMTLNSRLEKLFHASHTHAWNGPEVIRQAAKNRAALSPSERTALAQFASLMMAVEMTSWNQSLRLASVLSLPEARLAATAQAADEANHFVTVREYLHDLGFERMPVHPRLAALLGEIEQAADPAAAFLQLHLVVENVTTILFKRLAKTHTDVVLSKVMPYYLRDESRHVTFAQLYVPELVDAATPEDISRWAGIWANSIQEVTAWLEEERDLFEALRLPVDEVVAEMLEVESELTSLSPVLTDVVRRAQVCRPLPASAFLN